MSETNEQLSQSIRRQAKAAASQVEAERVDLTRLADRRLIRRLATELQKLAASAEQGTTLPPEEIASMGNLAEKTLAWLDEHETSLSG